MSWLDRTEGIGAEAIDRSDERLWNSGVSYHSSTGIAVTPSLALRTSCVFQGVRLYAEGLASLPVKLYREGADGAKEPAKDNALFPVLRKRPNGWQTAQQWREMMTAFAVLWGMGASEIRPGPRGAVDELIPIHPDWIQVEQLASRRFRYVVNEPNFPQRILVQEQVFRLEGLGIDNKLPFNLLSLAREAVGKWLALERFGSLFFGQGAKPSVWLEHPATLSDPAYDKLMASVQNKYGGLNKMHKVFIAEEGLKVKETGFNARDSQMTEAIESQVHEIARWMNIPVHMFRAGQQPTFASIEAFAREWVDISLRPWATRWEGTIARDLIWEEDVYAELLFDAILRGDTASRFAAYAVGIVNGFMTRNEARARENMSPLDGLDEPVLQLNVGRSDGAPAAPNGPLPKEQPAQAPPPSPRKKDGAALVTMASAQRVIRRESAELGNKAAKYAAKPEAWAEFVGEFYARHAEYVADAMQLPPLLVRRYIESHRSAVLLGGVSAIARWGQAVPEGAGPLLDGEGAAQALAALVLED